MSKYRARSVRVVVPAFRAEATIRECAGAIAAAIAASSLDANVEIVVVDDGGNPHLEEVLSGLPVTIRRTGGSRSAAVARNLGAADFRQGVIVFIDADVVIQPDTLAWLASPILADEADAVVGNYSRDVRGLSFAAKYKQLYISRVYERRAGPIRNDFWTAIGAVDAATFHAVGGFDQSFTGACGEDSELGVRLTAGGQRILGVPEAIGRHRPALDLRKLVLNDWRKGRAALQNWANANGPLSDNKHATPRDVASVILAVSVLGGAGGALGAAVGLPAILALPLVLVLLGYLIARSDVMARFASHGALFSFRAFWTMLVLDLVRFACVLSRVLEPHPGAALEVSTVAQRRSTRRA